MIAFQGSESIALWNGAQGDEEGEKKTITEE